MNDTPKTDALREVIIGQYKEDELTGNGMGNLLAALTDIETLERERDAERALAEQRGRLYDTAVRQLKELQAQVDELNDKIRYNEVESSHNWRNRERDRDALAAWKEARSE